MTIPMRRWADIPKAYLPQNVEERLYRFWMEKGYFTARIDPDKKPFVIIMPPPNITGELHLGHALTATLEDIIIRWHRMLGEPTLWLPGSDHAGIATQNVVEQLLSNEGLTRHHLGRERFVERVWEWREKYGRIIAEQHRRLGASCDWTRERFTLDEGPARAVRTTFYNLYQKGLIYRGERIINWCPRCSTALSDLEVEHEVVPANLYYVRYRLVPQDSDVEPEHITVATTRPETIMGDTAVAVNPCDERFKGLLGRKAILPVIDRVIPIIGDEAVDPTFGTGALKITPGHDPVDFEIGQRHHLPIVNTVNLDGTMNAEAGPYEGMTLLACREAVLRDLAEEGLLIKSEPYTHSIGHCQRCRTIVEPLVSEQWFVRIAPLAQPAIEAVRDGRIRIVPERFTKVYLHWMENIRDWCISRQLWWGHRIPVWYCQDCGELVVAVDTPTNCSKCESARLEQDPDVLDTWFSSALWPHSTLGWPDETEDFRYFYPTSVMETGYDILFFWVARMIMMGLENTRKVPFHTVYLHGLVRDEKGDKMSKSRGNVLNPVELMDQYGSDALRFALSTGSTPGNDMRLFSDRLEAGRNFANKLWNAARFVMGNMGEEKPHLSSDEPILPMEDRWILSRLGHTIQSVNQLMADYQFGEAGHRIHDFFWGEYCDWYVELAKLRLRELSSAGHPSPLPVLVRVLETSLRLLHPFMPFVTEEIWQNLRQRVPQMDHSVDSVVIAPYPTSGPPADPTAEGVMNDVIQVVRAIRNARAEHKVELSRRIEALIFGPQDHLGPLKEHVEAIQELAKVRNLEFGTEKGRCPEQALALVLDNVEVRLPWAGFIDIAAERARLTQEVNTIQAEIARLEAKLTNSNFISRAPAIVVQRERERWTMAQDRLERLVERLSTLG